MIFGSSVSFISVSFVHKFFVPGVIPGDLARRARLIFRSSSLFISPFLSPNIPGFPLRHFSILFYFPFHSFSLFSVFEKWLHSTPWWRIIIAAWLVFIQNLTYCINHFFHKINHVLKIFNNLSTSVKKNQLNSSNSKDCIT